ncbi:RNA-directed DNA polymerase (reverse transcriptase)-related family protein [Rhynchospora pubera]|uniref:RNA-directed DNA polymerase (Reverse transcriptase)-related family protein n=1 Tax=Rhynchospora pubera TaxID=906938 RepID=A0AAV8CMV5_9POAL|nr:RNA-directed DNA polymerase (reverse transcriptase)-related family protein [Rhynchospora pubera]
MDVLSRLLDFHAHKGYLTGLQIAPATPLLTSIMFADDLIIFGEASETQAVRTVRILNTFCELSGQQVGQEKSRIWFSRGTTQQTKACIMRILSAGEGNDSHIYLSVPVVASRPAHFHHLINKIKGKVSSWASRCLSQAAKVVLIRTVIEPLVLYSTAGGPMPATVIHTVNSLIRSFFWENGGSQKMHLISWNRITSHKLQGGLGLRDVRVINEAMMLKLLWKLGCKENEDRPWVQLLRAKYLSRKCLWLSKVPANCTKLWRAMMELRPLLKPVIKWHIQRGDKCTVFGEPWHDLWQALNPTNARQRKLKLVDLTEDDGSVWDHDKLADAVGRGVGLHIISLYPQPPITTSSRQDRLIFTPSSSGKFSYKEACKLIQGDQGQLNSMKAAVLKAIWHCPGIIPRIRLFLWKIVSDGLPIKGTCAARLGQPIPECRICNQSSEVVMHALFHCPFSQAYWFASNPAIRMLDLPADITGLLFSILQSLQGSQFVSFANHLWALWKNRCTHIFTGAQLTHDSCWQLAGYYNRLSRLSSSMVIAKPLSHIWNSSTAPVTLGYTCYTDGSFLHPSKGGWAFIIFKQDVLVCYGTQAGTALSPIGTEIAAMHLAVKALQEMGIHECLFYTDCIMLQQILEARIAPDVVPWKDFNATLDLLNDFRLNVGYSCTFIPRENNLDSHLLANYARVHNVSCISYTFSSFVFA